MRFTTATQRTIIVLAVTLLGLVMARTATAEGRRVICLDGTWQIAEGTMDEIPETFSHEVPVPGLADMATPAFEAVGEDESAQYREAFWYRRTFSIDGPIPSVARLKIHKAKFGSRVYLNGQLIGDNVACFTPGWFDVKQALRGEGEENELIVRVGALRESVPRSVPDGFDFEKIRYIPGIYDTVELHLSGLPYIENVQTAPDIDRHEVRVVVEVKNGGKPTETAVTCRIREAGSERPVGKTTSSPLKLAPGQTGKVELVVPIEDCRLWTPEDPFLYKLLASTEGDSLPVRFGMRTFSFDPKTKLALLNGKPYPMRGTNVCVYRFFEDLVRGDRPWREAWVRRLHRAFKSMNWNSARYCIGFPPEMWYRIADEEGILIQDEFPIWFGGRWPEELTSPTLIEQYTAWMRERWNHPCVVVWDAQNESRTTETGKAIQAVRGLDLSDRPWDNGWSEPQSPLDVFEAHPYPFYSRLLNRDEGQASWNRVATTFRLRDFAGKAGAPGVPGGLRGGALMNTEGNPVIINEYGWLWLNRDGSPTTLTKANYEALLGPNSTVEERRELYARYLAAMTEFWRTHREVAAVLHFCGLAYSRPEGQTSDHFLDIEKLNFEPHFKRYVGDAFAPVGLMVDHWQDDVAGGEPRQVPVVVINDRQEPWGGSVRLELRRGEEVLQQRAQKCSLGPVGRQVVRFEIDVPEQPSQYELVGTLSSKGQEEVRSHRHFSVLTDEQRERRDGISLGKPVKASSVASKGGVTYPAEAAVDGDPTTRWSSEFSDPQWIAVDLGEKRSVSGVQLVWESAHGKAFAIQVSDDAEHWTDVYRTESSAGLSEPIRFEPTEARWVRMFGTKRATPYGYSLWEFRVFP